MSWKENCTESCFEYQTIIFWAIWYFLVDQKERCNLHFYGNTYLAARQADADDVALGGFDLAKEVALLFVRHPARLFRVIRFRLVDPLLLEGDEEVWGRIGIFSLLLYRGWHLCYFFWALLVVNWCRGTDGFPCEVSLLLRWEGRTASLLPVVCLRGLLLVRRRTDYFWRHVLSGPGKRSIRTSHAFGSPTARFTKLRLLVSTLVQNS